ncbi:retinoic acid early-inducible protein 1-gamma-like [Mus pahari]|uniref:retinoic acid early-inducible protein 1-gamma-like n=1 Tax=Mus pahari TaxID=10093 RepID=UPI001114ACE3|nr:retinoic acid early-inducible protein 1-gamma-like [Mus pahari]
MAKAAATKCNHSMIQRLLILLSCGYTKLLAQSPTLCCRFDVSNTFNDNLTSGLWNYEVQGEVKTVPFILNRNNKCHVTSDFGNRPNGTEICEKQFHSLQGQVYQFQDVLLQMRGENNTIRDPLTLQSIVCGWYADERYMGSWKVSLNGSRIFHGDIKRWLHIYPGSNWTEEILEKIKNLNDFLNRTSQGEFKNKFKEYNLHCKENLEPTAWSTTAADVGQPPSRAQMPNPSVLLIMLSCFLLDVF